jgi:hypothetical protein
MYQMTTVKAPAVGELLKVRVKLDCGYEEGNPHSG